MSIKSYNFRGPQKGKHLLILGAIHGNEPCGPIAIQKIINEIQKGEIQINKGEITCIPICNPQAFKENKRYIESNLNRVFKPGLDTQSYEHLLAEKIRGYIDSCDYMIDIHSLSGGNDVFLFKSDYNDQEIDIFAQATGVEQVIKGRDTIYEQIQEWTTDDYIRNIGKKGICIECGQHQDPQAPVVAYNAIINCMKQLQIIEGDPKYNTAQYTYTMEKLYYKENEGAFTQQRKHGDFIQKGKTIATYANGDKITTEKDNYILLPKHRAQKGEERFYLGIKE